MKAREGVAVNLVEFPLFVLLKYYAWKNALIVREYVVLVLETGIFVVWTITKQKAFSRGWCEWHLRVHHSTVTGLNYGRNFPAFMRQTSFFSDSVFFFFSTTHFYLIIKCFSSSKFFFILFRFTRQVKHIIKKDIT